MGWEGREVLDGGAGTGVGGARVGGSGSERMCLGRYHERFRNCCHTWAFPLHVNI